MVSSADKTREGVVPLIELRRVRRTKPESTHLGTHARNVTSQYGEDGIIARIFELIGARSKWCVEFGASDGPVSLAGMTLIVTSRRLFV
jgi:hypothetical protein